MKIYGLIGFPLSHSWSAHYFRQKFDELKLEDHDYRLFPLEKIEEFSALLTEHPGIRGLNVTIPYKVAIIEFLEEINEEASQIGAVNCISFVAEAGRKIAKGYNTDCYGFRHSLEPLLERHHGNALILGTGGASRAVAYVLQKLGIRYRFVSRNPGSEQSLSYEMLDRKIIEESPLIINTTPAGMVPDVKSSPALPYQFLSKKHLLYDLIYNPAETEFLKKGQMQGARTKNGLEMLQLQAEESWRIWNSPAIS